MVETAKPQDKTNLVRRLARLWSAIVIFTTVFVVIQNLRDPQQYLSNGRAVISVITLTLLVSVFGLALAWRWELLGGFVNLGFFLLSLILYWIVNGELPPLDSLALMLLLIIPGILFLLSARREKSQLPA
jgi:hypothetical protein